MINFPGPDKLILLAIIALVVLGPTRLPAAARTAGRMVGELRKLSARFQEEMHSSFGEHTDSLTSAVGDLRNQVGSLRNDLTGFARPLSGATSSPANGTGPIESIPSARAEQSVSAGTAPVGIPPLPPVPDDPSLN